MVSRESTLSSLTSSSVDTSVALFERLGWLSLSVIVFGAGFYVGRKYSNVNEIKLSTDKETLPESTDKETTIPKNNNEGS